MRLERGVQPERSCLASGSDDKTVDSEVRPARSVVSQGSRRAVQSVAFSPDGQRLATGLITRRCKVWDMRKRDKELL